MINQDHAADDKRVEIDMPWYLRLRHLRRHLVPYLQQSQKEVRASIFGAIVIFAVTYLLAPYPGKGGVLDLPTESMSYRLYLSALGAGVLGIYYTMLTIKAKGGPILNVLIYLVIIGSEGPVLHLLIDGKYLRYYDSPAFPQAIDESLLIAVTIFLTWILPIYAIVFVARRFYREKYNQWFEEYMPIQEFVDAVRKDDYSELPP